MVALLKLSLSLPRSVSLSSLCACFSHLKKPLLSALSFVFCSSVSGAWWVKLDWMKQLPSRKFTHLKYVRIFRFNKEGDGYVFSRASPFCACCTWSMGASWTSCTIILITGRLTSTVASWTQRPAASLTTHTTVSISTTFFWITDTARAIELVCACACAATRTHTRAHVLLCACVLCPFRHLDLSVSISFTTPTSTWTSSCFRCYSCLDYRDITVKLRVVPFCLPCHPPPPPPLPPSPYRRSPWPGCSGTAGASS